MKTAWILLFCCALVASAGCELEEDTIEAIGQADYYMSDPNSPVQVTAEQLEYLVAAAVAAVVAIPGFPYAKAILGALAVINAAIVLILKLRKRTVEKTLSSVVKAVDSVEKKPAKEYKGDKDYTTVGELVKDNVEYELQSNKIYRQGKALIQDAKNFT